MVETSDILLLGGVAVAGYIVYKTLGNPIKSVGEGVADVFDSGSGLIAGQLDFFNSALTSFEKDLSNIYKKIKDEGFQKEIITYVPYTPPTQQRNPFVPISGFEKLAYAPNATSITGQASYFSPSKTQPGYIVTPAVTPAQQKQSNVSRLIQKVVNSPFPSAIKRAFNFPSIKRVYGATVYS